MAEPVKESEIQEQDEARLAHSKIKQAQAVFQTFDKVTTSRKRYSKTHKTAQELALQIFHKLRGYLDTFAKEKAKRFQSIDNIMRVLPS